MSLASLELLSDLGPLIHQTSKEWRFVYFDIENEPTSFRERFPLTIPICIAWEIDGKMHHWAKNGGKSLDEGLEMFRAQVWDVDDIIPAGHNIRSHDIPILNGAAMRLGSPLFGAKRVRDTLRDLHSTKGVARSLEAFGVHFGTKVQKYHMGETEWEACWPMDTPATRAEVLERCGSDVKLNIEIGAIMEARGLIGPPRFWRP